MAERAIERELKAASGETPFYEKYVLLKHRLLKSEYEHWAAAFPHGNNHGPGHINRVLDNLDRILGGSLQEGIVTSYELFLAMMAILYHDVGILRARKDHADTSGKFLDEENDTYIFDHRDREIIRAAVVSHSSSKNIDQECAAFSAAESIGPHTARPRVIAALVRLADELDEDHRRADPNVAKKLNIGEEAQFFWQFCQRILAIRPDRKSQSIQINIQFEPDDAGRRVTVGGAPRLFVSAFAEKIAKINLERMIIAQYLPEPLKFQRILLTVRPLAGHSQWKYPREFTFNDRTTSSDFVNQLPELWVEPINKERKNILDQILTRDLESAAAGLDRLEEVLHDLPTEAQFRSLWNLANVWSLRAETFGAESMARQHALDRGVEYLNRWYQFGTTMAFAELDMTAANEIYKITQDREMGFLFLRRRGEIESFLGEDRRFLDHGGCVPRGTEIETPKGAVAVEHIQVGMDIFSANLEQPEGRILAKVVAVHQSSERICIRVNGRHLFTPSQPLYLGRDTWIRAEDLVVGTRIRCAEAPCRVVTKVEKVLNDLGVYTLTTDHPTHNFLVEGIICKNKQ